MKLVIMGYCKEEWIKREQAVHEHYIEVYGNAKKCICDPCEEIKKNKRKNKQ